MHVHVYNFAGSYSSLVRRWPVTLGTEQQPGSRGEAMVAELKWVHSMIRQDLQTVRRLADDVQGGMQAGRVAAGIRSLVTGGPLWQLKINCLQYCRFVHSHHHAESVMLFPALRRLNPELGPVVDKLEADHARVSGLLDEVEAASGELAAQEDPATRQRLTAALQVLSDELLAHLAYEEDHVSDTLRTMTAWPSW
jgi:Hemerythrin HHE cation binding domain